jgi:ribosomal protein L11 methyltransferase
VTNPSLWIASVTLARERAAHVAALIELTPPRPQAVLTAEDPFDADVTVEALYDAPPDVAFLSELTGLKVRAEPLPDQDWIRASQEGLPPVRAGRFFVYGAHDRGKIPHGVIAMRIEAAQAFGTGHHESTSLCLQALTQCARRTRHRNILDLGCGTGVLGIAAAKLWHEAVLAIDIDPIAIEASRFNAKMNQVTPFLRVGIADGMDHPLIRAGAPFDLVLANILAGPLTKLAPGIASAVAPKGIVVLSGLLRWQELLVLSFYRAQGLILRKVLRDGSWSALILERPRRGR